MNRFGAIFLFLCLASAPLACKPAMQTVQVAQGSQTEGVQKESLHADDGAAPLASSDLFHNCEPKPYIEPCVRTVERHGMLQVLELIDTSEGESNADKWQSVELHFYPDVALPLEAMNSFANGFRSKKLCIQADFNGVVPDEINEFKVQVVPAPCGAVCKVFLYDDDEGEEEEDDSRFGKKLDYGKDGLLLRESSLEKSDEKNEWDILYAFSYFYDELGRLVQKLRLDVVNYRIHSKYQYHYQNDSPCVSTEAFIWDDGKSISRNHLLYDANNRVIEEQTEYSAEGETNEPQLYLTRTERYIRDECIALPKWEAHKAKTIFDRTSKTSLVPRDPYDAFEGPVDESCINCRDVESTVSCMLELRKNEEDAKPIYNPEMAYDYEDVKSHFYNYRLAPEFALEEDDYEDIYDPNWARPSRPFWMSPTEVTQGEFEEIMGYNPSFFKNCGKRCPVENVTWFQALTYSNHKSEKEGLEKCYDLTDCTPKNESCKDVQFKGLDCKGYRLPTDEEWRFMAEKKGNNSIGKESYYYGAISRVEYEGCRETAIFVWDEERGKNVEKVACIGPHPVGEKPADDNGLYDFFGNVYEWVWDWFGYARRSGDSLGADRGWCRIMRGGSVYTGINDLMQKACYLPDRGGSVLGFRLVRTLQD